MKRKQLPRLWCALQGLLPLEACLAAQEAELAWPRPLAGDARGPAADAGRAETAGKRDVRAGGGGGARPGR